MRNDERALYDARRRACVSAVKDDDPGLGVLRCGVRGEARGDESNGWEVYDLPLDGVCCRDDDARWRVGVDGENWNRGDGIAAVDDCIIGILF